MRACAFTIFQKAKMAATSQYRSITQHLPQLFKATYLHIWHLALILVQVLRTPSYTLLPSERDLFFNSLLNLGMPSTHTVCLDTILVTLPGIHCFVHEDGEGFTQTSSPTKNKFSTSSSSVYRLTSNGTLQRYQKNKFEGTELSSAPFRGVTFYQNVASSGVIPPLSAILLIVR